MDKIFCIGLNKTGTTSLHHAFQILGFNSVHFRDDNRNNIKKLLANNYERGGDILHGLEDYDCFSDWDSYTYTGRIAKRMHEQYPDAKFILNTRDIDTWIHSREKHVLNNIANNQGKTDWLEVDKPLWKKEYIEHHAEMREYFQGNKNFIEFNVAAGDGWEKLCNFLNLDIPTVSFPKSNVRK